MDHAKVAQQHMTERYLLNELDPHAREEFEEHYFDCQECAFDVQTASVFIENSKRVWKEKPEEAKKVVPVPPKPGFFAWLRPAFAAPALAMLLAVVGYQNLVLPQLAQTGNHPQVLPWANVSVATFGPDAPVIPITSGQGFLLFTRIPEGGYASYKADLYNPAGEVEWSLTIPAEEGQDMWPIQVPGAKRKAGTYTMKVQGLTSTGAAKDLGSTQFELKIQN